MNLRAIILDILLETDDKNYVNQLLFLALSKYEYLDKQERAFISRVTRGVTEHRITLDYIIDSFSKTKTHKMKAVIVNSLRMAVYQIIFMDSVPDSAAVNESVKLVSHRGFNTLRGFVNAVLRSIVRKKEELLECDDNSKVSDSNPDSLSDESRIIPWLADIDKDKDILYYYSVLYSFPIDILKLLKKDYSIEEVKDILSGFTGERTTFIRVNTLKTDIDDYIERLEKSGISCKKDPRVPYALSISGYDYIAGIEGYEQGLFNVQDISSMMTAELFEPDKDDYVIDLCAAPGGKSINMAIKLAGLKGQGRVSSRDISDYKCGKISENLARMGLDNMSVKVSDASLKNEEETKADILIADLPCSGLGIIGRKPDIKYNVSLREIDELVKLQRKILTNSIGLLRAGGKLIYSTCTINSMENEDNLSWMQETLGLRLIKYNKLLPGRDNNNDGFFMALLEKAEA